MFCSLRLSAFNKEERKMTALSVNPNFRDLFEMRVSTSPDDVAVLYGEESVTFIELYQRAEQLADHLQASGVKPNDLVGIYVDRSLEMVVGILGILLSGGAYVPLDPAYPADRLSFILEDANIQIVVTQARLRNRIPIKVKDILCIGENPNWLSGQEPAGLRRNISSEDLAYVIYTSGSTGRPKGVMITHNNLCQFVRIAGQALDVLPTDRYLQTASISYALSVRQLMIPLVNGATLVIANSEQVREPLGLFELIKREHISVMDMVPSFWRVCTQRLLSLPVDERRELLDNNLRRIVSIGETLLSDIPRDWRFRLKHPARLVNIFGQTETTGVVATYPIPPVNRDEIEMVPIGRNVTDTVLYVLDADLHPVPIGEAGELCVSSPCLSLGYLNQPDVSAKKFIPNPFRDVGGNRLYRTGDMARYLKDGTIEFLGRSDFQVKIRGQRLELGEIEAVLLKYPKVKESVVVACGDHPDEKYLVAYIATDSTWKDSELDLRKYLKGFFPDHMLPSLFIRLDVFPVMPNGKINRRLLSDPAFVNAKSKQKSRLSSEKHLINHRTHPGEIIGYGSPGTRTEKIIVNIWRSLLHSDQIGVHDNFFDLGGDSLMAVRLFLCIEKEFGVRLPPTSLIHANTVAQISELVDHHDSTTTNWSPIVPFWTQGGRSPFFGIHGLGGGVLFWREIVDHLPKDLPFYGLQARGVDGFQPAQTSIHEMAALYLQGIRKIQAHGPYYLGGYSMGGEIAFEVAQQLRANNEVVALLVLFDTANPDRAARMAAISRKDGKKSEPPYRLFPAADSFMVLGRKAIGHLQRFSALNPHEKGRYIEKDIKTRVQRLRMYTLVKLYHSIQKRVPYTLLTRYLEESHRKALHNYIPRIYDGKITIFKASESLEKSPIDSNMGWDPLTTHELCVHVFNATHDNFMSGDTAREIAYKLNECLMNAQSVDPHTNKAFSLASSLIFSERSM
jgi:aspartate racemase